MGMHCTDRSCEVTRPVPLDDDALLRRHERMYDTWDAMFDDTKVSLRKARHRATERKVVEVLIPFRIFDWDANNMQLQYVTCENHNDSRWLTKHPVLRSWHQMSKTVCDCYSEDLRVVITQ